MKSNTYLFILLIVTFFALIAPFPLQAVIKITGPSEINAQPSKPVAIFFTLHSTVKEKQKITPLVTLPCGWKILSQTETITVSSKSDTVFMLSLYPSAQAPAISQLQVSFQTTNNILLSNHIVSLLLPETNTLVVRCLYSPVLLVPSTPDSIVWEISNSGNCDNKFYPQLNIEPVCNVYQYITGITLHPGETKHLHYSISLSNIYQQGNAHATLLLTNSYKEANQRKKQIYTDQQTIPFYPYINKVGYASYQIPGELVVGYSKENEPFEQRGYMDIFMQGALPNQSETFMSLYYHKRDFDKARPFYKEDDYHLSIENNHLSFLTGKNNYRFSPIYQQVYGDGYSVRWTDDQWQLTSILVKEDYRTRERWTQNQIQYLYNEHHKMGTYLVHREGIRKESELGITYTFLPLPFTTIDMESSLPITKKDSTATNPSVMGKLQLQNEQFDYSFQTITIPSSNISHWKEFHSFESILKTSIEDLQLRFGYLHRKIITNYTNSRNYQQYANDYSLGFLLPLQKKLKGNLDVNFSSQSTKQITTHNYENLVIKPSLNWKNDKLSISTWISYRQRKTNTTDYSTNYDADMNWRLTHSLTTYLKQEYAKQKNSSFNLSEIKVNWKPITPLYTSIGYSYYASITGNQTWDDRYEVSTSSTLELPNQNKLSFSITYANYWLPQRKDLLSFSLSFSIPFNTPILPDLPSRRVTGHVYNNVGEPVRNKIIRLDDNLVATNENGKYSFYGLSKGIHSLSFDSSIVDGLIPENQDSISVDVRNARHLRHDFQLTPSASLIGTLYLEKENKPFLVPLKQEEPSYEGIKIILTQVQTHKTKVVTSSANGHFIMKGMNTGDWEVSIDKSTLPSDLIPSADSSIIKLNTDTSNRILIPLHYKERNYRSIK